jgi:pilus assembly protein Flp/PilA
MRHHRRHDVGASAVEYSLLLAAVAAVVIVLVFGLGAITNGNFKQSCTALTSAPGGLDRHIPTLPSPAQGQPGLHGRPADATTEKTC